MNLFLAASKKEQLKSGHVVTDPCTLGACEHFFCSPCSEDLAGGDCMRCGMPTHARDRQTDRQADQAAKLCKRLARLLYHSEETDVPLSQVTPNTRGKSTVEAPGSIPATYNFSPSNASSPKQLRTRSRNAENITPDSSAKKAVPKKLAGRGRRGQQVVEPAVENESPDDVSIQPGTSNESKDTTAKKRGRAGKSKDAPKEEEMASEEDDLQEPVEEKIQRKRAVTKGSTKKAARNQKEAHNQKEARNQKENEMETEKENAGESISDILSSAFGVTVNEPNAEPQAVESGKKTGHKESKAHEENDTTSEEKDATGVETGADGNPRRQTRKSKSKTPNTNATAKRANRSVENPQVKEAEEADERSEGGAKSKEGGTKSDNTKDKKNKRKSADPAAIEPPPTTPKVPKLPSRRRSSAAMPSPSPGTVAKRAITPQRSRSVTPRQSADSTPQRTSQGRGRSSLTGSPMPSPVSVNKRNPKGETPLHKAAIKGDAMLLQQLLDQGAAPNMKDNAGWTPLHEACIHGHRQIAELLLLHGAFVNVPGMHNDTPLHDAVENGRLECVRLLLQNGASLNARNSSGLTAPQMARTAEMLRVIESEAPTDSETSRASAAMSPALLVPTQIVLLTTGLKRDAQAQLKKGASVLHAESTDTFSQKVTHLVSGVNAQGQCPRTLKYLQAVLAGKWIVHTEWLAHCVENRLHVNEEAFEVPGSSTNPDSLAPKKGRENMQNQLPGLFNGCHFYLKGEFSYPTPDVTQVSKLIRLGGGTLLTREPKPESLDHLDQTVPYHAEEKSALANCNLFIIHDVRDKPAALIGPRLCSAPASWLLDCIALFKLELLE